MKKKVVAALLCAAMTMTLFAGCGSKDGDTQQSESKNNSEQSSQPSGGEDSQTPSTPSGPADAEAIDVDPLYHFAMDGTDAGLKVVVTDKDNAPNGNTNFGIKEDSSIQQLITNGPVGQCTYLDGKYGIQLPMESLDSNEFTISFWYNADRMGTYGPLVQMGHNIEMANVADPGDTVSTWLNFTRSEWGADGVAIAPVIWSKNGATATQPWMASFDDVEHGKKEWVHVTLVATGETYDYTQVDAAAGTENVNKMVKAKIYLNGELRQTCDQAMDESFGWAAGLASDLMKASHGKFEAFVGINYWDVVYKGYIDEIYVYNKALTDGQVATLFAEGDLSVSSVQPESSTGGEDASATVNVNITGTAVGETDFSTGWWSAHSETWKVDSGATVTKTFTNYNKGEEASNWNNFLVVLQNIADAHSTDANADYKEYAVLRADNYGWRGTENTGENLEALGWNVESNWDWTTFVSDLNGATVVLSVTNNGSTADVVADVTTTAGKTYQQKYTNIGIDGDLYFCLSVDGSCIDIQN